MKNFTLYGLRKPGEEARYIGITCGVLNTRLTNHLSERTKDHRGRWVAKIKRENSTIEIIPYCIGLSEASACELEISVLAELRKIGADLVNTSPGGNLPPVVWGNKHALGKILGNKHALGVKHSPEHCARQSERSKGNKYAVGFKGSPEQNAKKSERMLGNKNTLGKKSSQETKNKLSAAQTLAWEKRRQESYLAEMWR